GVRLRKLGEVVTRTLECEPRRWKVVEHVREKFSCRDCEGITEPPAPSHPIARGHAGPTRFGFLLLCQFDFSNRLVKCKRHYLSRRLQGLRQHVHKLFRSFEITLTQGVDPANAFCSVFVAQPLYKFAARETEFGHPR